MRECCSILFTIVSARFPWWLIFSRLFLNWSNRSNFFLPDHLFWPLPVTPSKALTDLWKLLTKSAGFGSHVPRRSALPSEAIFSDWRVGPGGFQIFMRLLQFGIGFFQSVWFPFQPRRAIFPAPAFMVSTLQPKWTRLPSTIIAQRNLITTSATRERRNSDLDSRWSSFLSFIQTHQHWLPHLKT